MAAQFSGQVAIVTGGSQGLGEAVVKMLVENGASVAVFDMNRDKGTAVVEKLKDKEGRVEFFQASGIIVLVFNLSIGRCV